jgi:hypothetical protein
MISSDRHHHFPSLWLFSSVAGFHIHKCKIRYRSFIVRFQQKRGKIIFAEPQRQLVWAGIWDIFSTELVHHSRPFPYRLVRDCLHDR